ncbi:hypothetical protein J0H58_08555, partial [bacterium]|nr:hypothetical protein [bacterium]
GPCLDPANGRRIDVVTRLRFDARLYRPLDPPPRRRMGRPRKWGDRLPAPQHHDRWGVPWQDGPRVSEEHSASSASRNWQSCTRILSW